MINPVKILGITKFEWINLKSPSEEELTAIGEKYHLHPAALQDCLQADHLPKYELIEEIQFIICRYYDIGCAKDSDTIQALTNKLSIFYSKDLLITVQLKETAIFDEIIEKYNGELPSSEVVCKLIKNCLTSFNAPIKKLDTEIDFYESRIFLKKRIQDLIKGLYRIKRQAYVMRKLINLTKEIITKTTETSSKKGAISQDLKDYYLKLDTQIEEVYDSILSLLNIYISLSSQRTNEVMRTLTVFTAFFLPLTFIVGVYGMNFQYMPEIKETWGYPAVLVFMLGITVAVWTWFKRKGWL